MNQINYINEDFGNLIKNLKQAVESYFCTYSDEYGITSDEFTDFIVYAIDADIVDTGDSLMLVYKPTIKSVSKLAAFLNNRDIICMRSNTVSMSKSNCKDAARIIMKMINLVKI